MNRRLKFFLIFASLWLLCSLTTFGQCTCAKPNISALEEYKNASAVFTGEIIDIQNSERDKNDRYYETVRVVINRVWKKDSESTITIKNYVSGCVQGWKKGDKYLIYAYLNEDKTTYSTGCCCSRTSNLERSADDISEFMKAGYSQTKITAISPKERIVSAGWMNRRALNFVNPKYPKTVVNRVTGRVEVKILTDVEGMVISAEVIRGPADFYEVAIDAAKKLRFPPILLSGVPTKVSGWISYDFKP